MTHFCPKVAADHPVLQYIGFSQNSSISFFLMISTFCRQIVYSTATIPKRLRLFRYLLSHLLLRGLLGKCIFLWRRGGWRGSSQMKSFWRRFWWKVGILGVRLGKIWLHTFSFSAVFIISRKSSRPLLGLFSIQIYQAKWPHQPFVIPVYRKSLIYPSLLCYYFKR